MNSTEFFKALFKDVKFACETTWWPNFGTFEVVVGAILTQQTKWENVEKALANLHEFDTMSVEKIASLEIEILANLIKPSGFYNIKAKRLKTLCEAIVDEFGDFESFKNAVSREWLLSQKGLGEESVDSVLCYACARDEMVVDSYTLRVLSYLDYEFESYNEAKEWLSSLDFAEIFEFTNLQSENEVYAMYHGLIVEFCKTNLRGREFSQYAKDMLDALR